MILETSWEVCNKMGGIYTVLSSRARVMMERHAGEIVFVGPLLAAEGEPYPLDFEPCVPEQLLPWVERGQRDFPLRTVVGRWRIPGEPAVVLVDFSPLWQERDALYFEMWSQYGLQGDKGYGDYDECCLFAVAAARTMGSIEAFTHRDGDRSILIFNEWQTAMGLLYNRIYAPQLASMFITHATTVGRSIAGNGKELYEYMPHYNGDQMAAELNVEAKHAVEKRAAHEASVFATVSKLTARECSQLIERTPIVLPNGFEADFVPQGRAFGAARKRARKHLAEVARVLTGREIEEDALFVSLGGRYEYRNKGIDLFVESIARLRERHREGRSVVAFLLVPAWVAEPRADLAYLLKHPKELTHEPMQHPTLTHWLHNLESDATQSHLRHLGLDRARADEAVHFVFVPCYLDGHDGIMNMSYYDLLIGMDMTVYPSYYEPWGYTPLESIAFGVPTITTGFAGFGLWAEEELEGDSAFERERLPVCLIRRTDHNRDEAIEAIVSQLERLVSGELPETAKMRRLAQDLASRAAWKHFYRYYEDAYRSITDHF